MLRSVDWNWWLHELDLSPYYLDLKIRMKTSCHLLVDQWLTIDTKELFHVTAELSARSVLEKMEFLSYLHASPTDLSINELRILRRAYECEEQFFVK